MPDTPNPRRRPVSPTYCYCGCHDTPEHATHVDPETGGNLCLACLTYAVNSDGEAVCSRHPEYALGRPGWQYYSDGYTARPLGRRPGLAVLK